MDEWTADGREDRGAPGYPLATPYFRESTGSEIHPIGKERGRIPLWSDFLQATRRC